MNLRPTLFRTLLPLLVILRPTLAGATELVIWSGYRAAERKAVEKVIDAYNAAKASSGVKVRMLSIPADAFLDKISAAIPRGVGPDVFVFPHDRLGGWAEAGNTLEPLNFFLDAATKKRFVPSTLEAMTYRGNVYGLPLNFKVITLIYNKKLVAKPPRTTGEMLAMCHERAAQKDGSLCLAWPYTDFYYFAPLMNAFGGRVFDPGAKPALGAPENVRALELLQRWRKVPALLPEDPSTALITSLFNEKKAALVFSGPWFLGEVASDIEYGLAPLPAVNEAGGKPMRPWMTVEGVAVAATSKNKEAAYDFVSYLTGPEAAKVMALEGRQNPAVAQIYSDPQVAADSVLAAFRSQAESAIPMPNIPEMTMVWSPAIIAVRSTVTGAASPKAALEEAQKTLQKDVAGLRGKR